MSKFARFQRKPSGRFSILYGGPTALVALCAVGLAQAQSPSEKDGGIAAYKAKYLNGSVYRIRILHNFYYWDKPTELYTATAVLVRAPNLLLTTRLVDSGNVGVYETYEKVAEYDEKRGRFTVDVCQEEPDRVRVETEKRATKDLQDKDKDKIEKNDKDIYYRYSSENAKEDADKKFKGNQKAQKDEQKQKVDKNFEPASTQDVLSANCAHFKVKKIDERRRLVLLEASDPLIGGIPEFNSNNPDIGAQITAYGFPVSVEGQSFETRRTTTEQRERTHLIPTLLTSTVSKVNQDDNRRDEGQMILHQASISRGMWGGPLVNECGDVIGLNTQAGQQSVITTSGSSQIDKKNQGKVGPNTVEIPTSGVFSAIGARELTTFAKLNGFELSTVATRCELASAAFFGFRQQNLWVLLSTTAALLLALAAMVVAIRRPGPVRSTVIKMFPNLARSSRTATSPPGYGDPYGGGVGHRVSSDYMSDAARTDAYAAKSPPSALRADPTDVIPASAGGGARLVPIGGGKSLALDPARLAGGGLTFGREADCDLVSDHNTVSKKHARITRASNGKLQIEDLGTANGTWRGRNRIQREAFGGGDIVRFGAVEYRVELSGGNGASSTLLMPSVSWELSGVEESGRAIRWHLEPTADGSGRQIETTWIVGRSTDGADLALTDKAVSSQHAKIRFTPQRGLEICDLGSSNGTKVDGRKITDSFVAIADARLIEFGNSKLSVSKR